jgi:hypothetical protein
MVDLVLAETEIQRGGPDAVDLVSGQAVVAGVDQAADQVRLPARQVAPAGPQRP